MPTEIHLNIIDALLVEPLYEGHDIQDHFPSLDMIKGIRSLCSVSSYREDLVLGAMNREMYSHKRQLIIAYEKYGSESVDHAEADLRHFRVVHRATRVRYLSDFAIQLGLKILDERRD